MYAGAALAVLNVIVSIAMQHTLPIAAGGMIAASLLVLSTQGLGVTTTTKPGLIRNKNSR